MALTDDVTGDPTLAFVVLIANLVALAAAVADLRQAQQHAAQAAAARQAAQHLRAGLAQARSQVPRPAPPERRERARRANSANAARDDFPMPPWLEHPVSGRPADVGARPHSRTLPRKRAGPRP
jgi:type II secretory pathway pseudopilin PulG